MRKFAHSLIRRADISGPCHPPRRARYYATLVGPTSLIPGPGPKHPLPPPPPPSPFPAPSAGGPTSRKSERAPAHTEPSEASLRAPPPPIKPSSLTPLDGFLLSCLRSLTVGKQPTVPELLQQLREKDGHQLSTTLAYEATPSKERRLQPDTEEPAGSRTTLPIWSASAGDLVRRAADLGTSRLNASGPPLVAPRPTRGGGVVLLAHVFPSKLAPSRIVTSLGIALETRPRSSRLVATCAYPLSHIDGRLSADRHVDPAAPHAPSASLILTGSGAVYPVSGVASSLGDSDILVLEAGDPLIGSGKEDEWETTPISPYPPPVGTAVHAHRFCGPEENGKQWEEAQITEYKDALGIAAKPGTYDFLSSFSFSAPPSAGASGGPVIGPAGSVVGLIRGSRADYGDRFERGFAVVSERLWEVFRLPGFKPASERRREIAGKALGGGATSGGDWNV